MRSRAGRLLLSTLALIAVAAAVFFVFQTEKQIATRRHDVRGFDQHAREVTERLADLRAAQQAYVAEGQGVAFWMPRVAALLEQVNGQFDALRAEAISANGRGLLTEAAAQFTEFGNVDGRAREYVKSGEMLMAGDVVFSEGSDTATGAARLVESARLAELQDLDVLESGIRRKQAMALGGAGGFSVLMLLTLALAAPGKREEETSTETSAAEPQKPGELRLRMAPISKEPVPVNLGKPRGTVPMLKAAAELCTDLGRVNDRGDLPRLMARAADVLDASGLVIWVGSQSGAELRPILAHGYPDHVLDRMPTVPRSADNAAATAYRTGSLQVVPQRPGVSNGAVVAPLLTPDGCIGALTAEIMSGSETTDGVQAMASLLAAQMSGIVAALAAAPPIPSAEQPAPRIASA